MKFWLQHYSCEPLNMSKWIYIWLDNLLHKTHITGKMKVPLSTKICFLSWTKKLRLLHCFSKSSLFLSSKWIYIWVDNSLYKTYITGKIKVSLSTKICFLSWTRNWDFSIVLASPVYFYPASEFIFEFTIYYIKLTLQVKWSYHYPPNFFLSWIEKLRF